MGFCLVNVPDEAGQGSARALWAWLSLLGVGKGRQGPAGITGSQEGQSGAGWDLLGVRKGSQGPAVLTGISKGRQGPAAIPGSIESVCNLPG